MWLSWVDDCALPWGQYSGVIEWCLLHRRAVYHIGLCAYVRGNLNTGCKHNSDGFSSLFGWVLHIPPPVTLQPPRGNQDKLYRGLFSSWVYRQRDTSQQKPAGQHKIHFKDQVWWMCMHMYTQTHRFSLEMCTSPQNVRNQGSDRDILTPEQEAVCSLFFLIWANSLHFPVID